MKPGVWKMCFKSFLRMVSILSNAGRIGMGPSMLKRCLNGNT